MRLRTIAATRYVTPLREGGSLPALVEASDEGAVGSPAEDTCELVVHLVGRERPLGRDPDHLGGARSVLADFGPAELWEGVRVPRHAPFNQLLRDAFGHGVRVVPRLAGATMTLTNPGGLGTDVQHPGGLPGPRHQSPW